MAEQVTPTPHRHNPSPLPPSRSRRRGALFIVLVAIASAVVGGVATRAIAQGFGYHGWHGGFRYGWMDPATLDKRIERGVKNLRKTAAPDEKKRA